MLFWEVEMLIFFIFVKDLFGIINSIQYIFQVRQHFIYIKAILGQTDKVQNNIYYMQNCFAIGK